MARGTRERVALPIALVYLLLIRVMILPCPCCLLPGLLGVPGGFPVCSHASGPADPGDPGNAPATSHDCCGGDCCLMPIAGLAPLILVASLMLAGRIWGPALVPRRSRQKVAGPPRRMASRPQAQRAPPRLAFV